MSDAFLPFEKLEVHELSVEFAVKVYHLTRDFPEAERFGLTNQLRRAAVSISLNIAEGRGRSTAKEFARFLTIARGSLFEVMSGARIAAELGFMTIQDQQLLKNMANKINAKLMALLKSLDNSV